MEAYWPKLPVHPRLCGEHDSLQAGHHLAGGSSPPVRGFIPACAGNTSTRNAFASLCIGIDRFIPACAGNTSYGQRKFGSSPPVRGTLLPAGLPVQQLRFIPACAGNTQTRCEKTRPLTAAVHPRLCGEHLFFNRQAPGYGLRFIPACAGNTCHSPGPGLHTARFIPACAGNTDRGLFLSSVLHGSSPPVRGTPAVHPACRCSPVHPRLCGEHAVEHGGAWRSDGSSPPVRGTRKKPALHHLLVRFIPACAGNTGPTQSRVRGTPLN